MTGGVLADETITNVAELTRVVADAFRDETAPDVMDLMMPVMDGAEATTELRREQPETKVVLLTTFGTSDALAHAMANGADGAVLKSSALRKLLLKM